MPLSVAAACSSKLKERQKRLRSASPQARLMRDSERRMHDQLHAAAFVEEALGDHGVCRWAARPAPPARLARTRRPARRPPVEPAFRDQELDARPRRSAISSRSSRHFLRKLERPARRFAAPERNRRRRAMRILHAHAARLHALDPPGSGAQQEHIARQALDREIFVERADHRAFRLGDHLVIARCPESRRRR